MSPTPKPSRPQGVPAAPGAGSADVLKTGAARAGDPGTPRIVEGQGVQPDPLATETLGLLEVDDLSVPVPIGIYQGRGSKKREVASPEPDMVETPAEAVTAPADTPPVGSWRADALRSATRLRNLGLDLKAEVRTEKPDPSWGWVPLCPEELVLSHLTTAPVHREAIAEMVDLLPLELVSTLDSLRNKGLIEINRSQVSATHQGQAVVAGRLADLERDNAVAIGAAQLFGAGLALELGSLDHHGYAQVLLNTLNRGTDPDRKLALLHVAAISTEESIARLETGADRPQGLDDLAAYLRWTLPPSVRPEAEAFLTRIAEVQSLSDHWAALEQAKIAGPATLGAFVAQPESYPFLSDGRASISSMQHASLMSLRALREVGGASSSDAARVAKAVIAASANQPVAQAEALTLHQAMAVLSPVVAVKAMLAEDGQKELLSGLRANRQEALALAHQVARPVLSGMNYDIQAAQNRLENILTHLGHEPSEREREHLVDNLRSIAALDGSTQRMLKPLHDAESPAEVHEALKVMAERIAEAEAGGGPQGSERFGAALRVLGMLAHGADVEDLERTHHAATLLASHPFVDEEERADATHLAATTRSILISVAGVMPDQAGRRALARDIGSSTETPAEVLAALRGALGPSATRLRPNLPWPSTMGEANLAAYADRARLGELRETLTLDALFASWSRRAAQPSGPSGPTVADAGFILPLQRPVADVKGLAYLRALLTEESLNDYGFFVVLEKGNRPFGMVIVEEEEDFPKAIAACRMHDGSCKMVKLGDNVPSSLVDKAKAAFLESHIAFSTFEFSDEQIAEALATPA